MKNSSILLLFILLCLSTRYVCAQTPDSNKIVSLIHQSVKGNGFSVEYAKVLISFENKELLSTYKTMLKERKSRSILYKFRWLVDSLLYDTVYTTGEFARSLRIRDQLKLSGIAHYYWRNNFKSFPFRAQSEINLIAGSGIAAFQESSSDDLFQNTEQTMQFGLEINLKIIPVLFRNKRTLDILYGFSYRSLVSSDGFTDLYGFKGGYHWLSSDRVYFEAFFQLITNFTEEYELYGVGFNASAFNIPVGITALMNSDTQLILFTTRVEISRLIRANSR